MKIILADAKTMKEQPCKDVARPLFEEETKELLACLQGQSIEQLQGMWRCSETIARENKQRLEKMELACDLTKAIEAYQGLVFANLGAASLDGKAMSYVNEHVRIVSGFYGLLRPMDGIRAYRLEMKSNVANIGSLYAYWGRKIHDALEDDLIVNLASKEFSSCIEKYCGPKTRMITCVFGEEKKGKLVQTATFAKICRGKMARWMAENRIEEVGLLKHFDQACLYRADLSDPAHFVFEKR